VFDVLFERYRNIQIPNKLFPLIASTVLHSLVLAVAIITPERRGASIKLINGRPMLVRLALEASSQCVFEPPRLNNRPVSPILSVTVSFQIHN
jgi:hypothetical protein